MWKNENIQRVTEAGPRVGFLAIKKKKKKKSSDGYNTAGSINKNK